MDFKIDDIEFCFHESDIYFDNDCTENLFSKKNDISLKSFLLYRIYSKYYRTIENNYQKYLDYKLGDFLLECKLKEDDFYKNFLHDYGDLLYRNFHFSEEKYYNKTGLYSWVVSNKVKYIKAVENNFAEALNETLGKPYPDDCFLKGKPEICHINSLICQNYNNCQLYICVINDKEIIPILERAYIRRYKPEWNCFSYQTLKET